MWTAITSVSPGRTRILRCLSVLQGIVAVLVPLIPGLQPLVQLLEEHVGVQLASLNFPMTDSLSLFAIFKAGCRRSQLFEVFLSNEGLVWIATTSVPPGRIRIPCCLLFLRCMVAALEPLNPVLQVLLQLLDKQL